MQMGNSFIIHTEAKIEDEWRCIDGYYRIKAYPSDEEKLKLAVTYENGSRSLFGSAYDKLYIIGETVPFSALSKEIQEEYKECRYAENYIGEATQEEASYPVISLPRFYSYVPKGFSHHGIVHKDRVASFENGEIEELWDESEELKGLPDISKDTYQYYEWDDLYDWPFYFKELKTRISENVSKYFDNAWYCNDDVEMRIVVFKF